MDRMVFESDGEVEACVRLQKPETLSNNASYTLFTRDGTALGIYQDMQFPTLDSSKIVARSLHEFSCFIST